MADSPDGPPPPPVGRGPQGWAPGNPDSNDQYYKPDPKTVIKPAVNLRKEYPKAAVPVYNQFQTGSCVANASSAALWYELKKLNADSMSPTGPSRLFVYYNARMLVPSTAANLADSGTWNRVAMKSLDKLGACLETSWPFGEGPKTVEKPLDTCFKEALDHTIDAYYRLDPDRPSDPTASGIKILDDNEKDKDGKVLLDNLRLCLSEGFPVVFAFRYYWDQPNWDMTEATWRMPDVWKDGIAKRHGNPPANPDPRSNGSFGGHAVLAVGYDESKQAVLVQNSWGVKVPGSTWQSEGGLFWMPYTWITDYVGTNDFWTIRKHRPAHGHFNLAQISEVVRQVKL